MKSFSLINQTKINEYNTATKMFTHASGAKILFLSNEDENKCFGIAFKTPPKDSTGVAHILEHTVLCGSEKYPVKDPFVQLLKGSLQTFLNAFTYPDKTCYPVASQNLKDFHNLVGVYLDAVFKPRISKDFFMQEGWHYHLKKTTDPLEYKGVVYNEMKGVYSSPESILMEYSQQSLFPDTTYGLNSGGDPEIIPQLTYEAFVNFHKKYYHPSNAYIYFYGDDPEDDRFKLLSEYLDDYSNIESVEEIPLQKPFNEPIRKIHEYAVSENENTSKPMFSINWVLPEPTNIKTVFTFTLLDHILLGTPASPLRKKLIESGLGEDLTGGGLETHLKQMCYSVGLKGIENSNLANAETLIFKTLEDLVKNRISKNDISAALNSFEFDLRENNSGGFPRGLALWLKSLNGWIYGSNPTEMIAFEEPLNKIKKEIQKPNFFENIIQNHFIKNTHRSIITLLPSSKLSGEIEEKEKKLLKKIKEGMNKNEIKEIQQQTLKLIQIQESCDSEEDLASLPLLQRNDIDLKIKKIASNEDKAQEAKIIHHDQHTNGILYLDIGLDLNNLELDEIPYISLLSSIYLEMGTKKRSYDELSQAISISTGGIYGIPFVSPYKNSNDSVRHLFFRSKCMMKNADELLEIFSEIFLYPDFKNVERFKQILLEHKADLESSIIPRGHSAVITRLKANYHSAHTILEKIGGIDAIFFTRELINNVDNDHEKIIQKLESIHRKIVSKKGLVINVTADENIFQIIKPKINKFLSNLSSMEGINIHHQQEKYPISEALIVPSRVNFVGAASNLFEHGYKFHGSALVISRYLQTSWLWEKIRVQGGAYGGICDFDQQSGTFSFASYRDPNLEASIEIYKKTGDYLKNIKLNESELTRAIIGAIGQLDAYMLPDLKGYTNIKRKLTGYTDQKRQEVRDQILSTNPNDFYHFGECLETAFITPRITVLCNQQSAKIAKLEKETFIL